MNKAKLRMWWDDNWLKFLLWIIGIATVHLSTALWVLAVLNNLAALQRVAHVVKRASGRSAAPPIDVPH